jgi:hypothetical protein
MAIDPPQPDQPPPELRWFQYRLRSLFVLTTLVAIACSWLAVTMQNQRQQKAAAEAIEKAGGEVESEPTWLGKLLRDDSLVTVTWVNGSGRPHLNGGRLDDGPMPSLVATNTVLLHLEGLSQLQWLDLSGTRVTDAGLVRLQGFKRLGVLNLDNTEITDAGLEHLKGLNQLQKLCLVNTKVTDEGVKKLQQALPKCKIER